MSATGDVVPTDATPHGAKWEEALNTKVIAPSLGLLLLRLGAGGLLFYCHGWDKLMHFAERAPKFANPIGLGPEASFTLVVFAEVVCSTLVAVGLATRLACIPLVIFFLVATFIQHAADPLADKELAVVYLIMFSTVLLMGAGRYSIDAMIRRRPGTRDL
jgi:putative oxidoreductase